MYILNIRMEISLDTDNFFDSFSKLQIETHAQNENNRKKNFSLEVLKSSLKPNKLLC